jgi:ATP-dependent helicase HrpB
VERVRYLAARPGQAKSDELRKLRAEDWIGDALGAAIAAAAVDWLSPSGPILDEAGLYGILGAMLGGALAALDAAVPPFVTTPGGKRRRPEYPAAGRARLSAKIQEFFGMADGPKACGEPMTLELLSPAERPLQVTGDLSGFWKNTYPAIKAEMSRRYPRHYWPDDPLVAEATKGQKPRK